MRWLQLCLIVLLLPLAGCALNGKITSYPVETRGVYTLGPGDVLRVKVYGDETVTGSYKVDDAGTVSMPLVGQIMVSGRTSAPASSPRRSPTAMSATPMSPSRSKPTARSSSRAPCAMAGSSPTSPA